MTIRDVGELRISEMDWGHFPVGSLLIKPKNSGDPWVWTADCSHFASEFAEGKKKWRIEADSKEEIIELVREIVVPIYLFHLSQLSTLGEDGHVGLDDTGSRVPTSPESLKALDDIRDGVVRYRKLASLD